ncbi:hypothetical protein HII31_08194 [Pseudocercospora fuligena]|uniref:Uncharacterized protein n=1 Tax=Pseudocercospora fuligena TaxID=685502 RepID=A0A8H6VGE3_9PEZI|nr:hypothetical protein HII31_08194 [Pseudocercospora fuligena]
MPDQSRAAMYTPSSTSQNAAVLPSRPSTLPETDPPVSEIDTQRTTRSGTSASLARSPRHQPQPAQLLVSFPRCRRHQPQRETSTEAGDSDSDADDEGLENVRRVGLSYEGTLWAFEKMGESGWINGKDYRRAREWERPRPVERPRPAPLRVDFPFASGRRNAVGATLPSTRAPGTPQISPRTNEVPPENQQQAPPMRQPAPRLMDFVAAANPSTRRPSYSQLAAGPNEGTPARIPAYAQAVPASNEVPPRNRRPAPSVRPQLPSWTHERS